MAPHGPEAVSATGTWGQAGPADMKVSNARTSLSQESVAILSVGGVLLGTTVALGALILTTTERIEDRIGRVEDRIGRVEHRIERIEDRLLAAEKEIASLRVDIAELRSSIERLEADVTGMRGDPPASRS